MIEDPTTRFSSGSFGLEEPRVLLVDDAPINLQVLHGLLHGRGFSLRTAESAEDALRIARKVDPDLILLDIVMPGQDGFETCRLLKDDPQTSRAAVIFMSSLNELDSKVQGFRLGAVDYITKPFEAEEVLARVNTHLRVQRLQRSFERARDQALEATKAKSRFLARMTHELRTPLNVIIGYSEMLLGEAADRGESHRDLLPDLGNIRAAGQDMLRLINGILDLSKVEAGKMDLHIEPFDADELLQEVCEMALPLVQPNSNRIESDFEGLGEVLMDRLKLKQILLNLLSNACKFTKAGTITLMGRRREEALWLEVRDTGIGLSEKQQAQIFDEFAQAEATTTRDFGGTGLGLSIVRHLCELMAGRISVESVPGEGSIFRLHFPNAV